MWTILTALLKIILENPIFNENFNSIMGILSRFPWHRKEWARYFLEKTKQKEIVTLILNVDSLSIQFARLC